MHICTFNIPAVQLGAMGLLPLTTIAFIYFYKPHCLNNAIYIDPAVNQLYSGLVEYDLLETTYLNTMQQVLSCEC